MADSSATPNGVMNEESSLENVQYVGSTATKCFVFLMLLQVTILIIFVEWF